MSRTSRKAIWFAVAACAAVIIAYLVYSGQQAEGQTEEAAVGSLEATEPGAEAATGAPELDELEGAEAPAEVSTAGEQEEAEPAAGEVPEEGPRIKFDSSTWDFGHMYQEQKSTHTFTFQNVGTEPLMIQKVRSTCGCTAALPSEREIAPGGEAAITVTFSSQRMRDRVTKHIYVESNDPVEPRATLTITAQIKMEVSVSPAGIYVGKLLPGETATRSVELLPVDVRSFKIVRTRVTQRLIEVTRTERVKVKGKRGYRLTIRYGPAGRPGRVSGTVIVETDLPHTKDVTIRLYGRVVSPEEGNEQTAGQ